MGFEIPSSVGIILLALSIKLLFCLLYWLLVLRRNKARRLQSDAEDHDREQEHQQHQRERRQQQHQQRRHLAANPPPAYQDVVNTNKYPIYVISSEDFDPDPHNKPPAYEFAIRKSTTNTVEGL